MSTLKQIRYKIQRVNNKARPAFIFLNNYVINQPILLIFSAQYNGKSDQKLLTMTLHLYVTLTKRKTINSAIAVKPRDAFRGQSRLSNDSIC